MTINQILSPAALNQTSAARKARQIRLIILAAIIFLTAYSLASRDEYLTAKKAALYGAVVPSLNR